MFMRKTKRAQDGGGSSVNQDALKGTGNFRRAQDGGGSSVNQDALKGKGNFRRAQDGGGSSVNQDTLQDEGNFWRAQDGGGSSVNQDTLQDEGNFWRGQDGGGRNFNLSTFQEQGNFGRQQMMNQMQSSVMPIGGGGQSGRLEDETLALSILSNILDSGTPTMNTGMNQTNLRQVKKIRQSLGTPTMNTGMNQTNLFQVKKVKKSLANRLGKPNGPPSQFSNQNVNGGSFSRSRSQLGRNISVKSRQSGGKDQNRKSAFERLGKKRNKNQGSNQKQNSANKSKKGGSQAKESNKKTDEANMDKDVIFRCSSLPCKTHISARFGHDTCRQHAPCNKQHGSYYYWDPEGCLVCKEMLSETSSTEVGSNALLKLRGWVKSWAKSNLASGSPYLPSRAMRDLVCPGVPDETIVPDCGSLPRKGQKTKGGVIPNEEVLRCAKITCNTRISARLGHDTCRPHAPCYREYGSFPYWDPKGCSVCKDMLKELRLTKDGPALEKLHGWIKYWVKSHSGTGSPYLPCKAIRDLVLPDAPDETIVPDDISLTLRDQDTEDENDVLLVKSLKCHICEEESFDSIESFKNHKKSGEHKLLYSIHLQRHDAALKLMRADAKLAATRTGRQFSKVNARCTKCDYIVVGDLHLKCHLKSIEHELINNHGNIECCGLMFFRRKDFVNHCLSIPHLRKQMDEKTDNPSEEKVVLAHTEQERIALQTLRDLKDKDYLDSESVDDFPEYDPEKPIGLSDVRSRRQYYCNICNKTFPTDNKMALSHCRSFSHYQMLLSYLEEKLPDGEDEPIPKKEKNIKVEETFEEEMEHDADEIEEIEGENFPPLHESFKLEEEMVDDKVEDWNNEQDSESVDNEGTLKEDMNDGIEEEEKNRELQLDRIAERRRARRARVIKYF